MAALLAVGLLTAVLTGCRAETGRMDDRPAAQAGETSAGTEYAPPVSGYRGRTFCIAAYQFEPNHGSWHAKDYCEVMAEEENGDQINDAIFRRRIAVEDALDLSLSVFPLTNIGESYGVLSRMIQADDGSVDMAMISGMHLAAFTADRMLADLRNIDTLDLGHSWWDSREVDDLSVNDRLYAATGDISLYLDFSQITWFFNKQVAEDLQLADPYQAVYDGTWTLDLAIAMASQASRDLDGDGKTSFLSDAYGLMCEPSTMVQAVYASGIRLVEKDADGVPYVALDENMDRASALTERLVPFLNDRSKTLLSIRLPKGYNSVFYEVFLPMFTEDRALFFSNQLLVTLDLRNMDSDFGILPFPKQDEDQKDYASPIGPYWATFAVVPVTNRDRDLAGDVMEALGYYGQQIIRPDFVDKCVRHRSLRDEDSSAMLDLIFSHRTYDLAMIYDCGKLEEVFQMLVDKNSTNLASRYATYRSSIAKQLAKTVKNIYKAAP